MGRYIFIALMVTSALLFSSIPNIMASSDSPAWDIKEAIQSYDDEVWMHWMKDDNHNGIDDIIEFMHPDERIDILVNYDHHPDTKDVEKLSEFDLYINFVYNILDSISVHDVAVSDIDEIVDLPGVKDVIFDGELPALLDVSARTIKARESEEYSPKTASDLGFFGSGITIAILDSGVDDGLIGTPPGGHASLNDLDDDPETDDPKFVAGNDYTRTVWYNGDDYDLINPNDEGGHGTHVAGIALGTGDGAGDGEYRGVAPQAYLADVKVMENYGVGDLTAIIAGIDFCIRFKDEANIRVLSMSIGGYNSNGDDTIAHKVNEAVYENGLVVVGGVGNDGLNSIPPIAAADGAIAVGSIDDQGTVNRSDDAISTFSNRGPRNNGTIDINDLKPDVVAPGELINSALRDTPSAYISQTGTSMSTPHVAGVVALMLEANPNLTPKMVKEILRATAWMPPGVEPSYPEIDPVYNVRWGWGIVDAYEAIKMVQQYDPRPPIISDIQEYVSGVTTTITWRTHKEANSTILYGKSQDQLDHEVSDPDNYTFDHSTTLTNLEEDTKYYYKILGYDEMGNGPGESDIRWFQTEILPDTKPPEISNVRVVAKSDRTATIFWDTNELADSSVEYGLTSEYGEVRSDFKLMWKHSITLFNLEPSTKYHFRVNSTDASENNNHSDDLTFTTDASPDEMAPIISGIKVIDITDTSVTFVWISNEPSNAVIRYNEKYNEDPKYWKKVTALDYYWEDFSIKITGLTPSTVYYYQIESRDPSDNSRTYGDSSTKFNTTGPPDNTAPSILDGPKVSILTDTTATIEWITDEESEGAVEYGLTTNYGSIEPKEPSGEYTFVHNITLTGLTPSTQYHFRVRCKDGSPNANEYISNDKTFTTKDELDLKPPKILEGPTLLEVGEHTATIIWTTNEDSNSVLNYGTTPDYGFTVSDPSLVREHRIILTNLVHSTLYYYQIVSSDESGNPVESGGHTFTTLEIVIPIEIDFINLQNGQRLSGVYRIDGKISGGIGDIEVVQYKIDNESWKSLGKGSTFSIVLDTSEYSEGEHTLYVRVEVGEMTMQEDMTFLVEHQTGDEEGIWTWIIFLVIMVVIILTVLLLISRSNARKRPVTKEPESILTGPDMPYPMDMYPPSDAEELRFFTEEPPLASQETEEGISFIPETTILSQEPEMSFIPDREPISFNISEEEPISSVFDTVRCPRCKNMFNADISSKIQCPECGFSASLKR